MNAKDEIIGMSGIQDFLFVPRSWHADYKIQHILSFVSRCSRQLGSLWVKAILREEFGATFVNRKWGLFLSNVITIPNLYCIKSTSGWRA